MKRELLLIFTLLVAISSKAEITPGENQMWWGYFNESDAANLPYSGYIGNNGSCTIDAAIRIPASEEIVSGSSIKAIRLWLGSDVSAISSTLRVWISTSLPAQNTIRADYRKTIKKADIVGGLNEVELDSAFVVDHRDIYVGFTFNINKKSYPVMAYGDDVPDGFYYRTYSGTNYSSWSNLYGNEYGRLALQVLVEAKEFPTNCVSVSDFGETMILMGKSKSIPITITNKGMNAVKSIAYTITSEDGEINEEGKKSFTAISNNVSKTFNISFEAGKEPVKAQRTFTVTMVNDEPNTAFANSGTGFVITLKEEKQVKPVIEEFTGTWCGWCPRGIVGMDKVHEEYGDKVVQIAAHSGSSDPMQISAYSSIINTYCDGYPGSITDRQFEADPSFSGLRSALSQAFNRVPPAAIELYAEWATEEQKAVVFNTTTSFAYSGYNNQYAIAFVLVEDGLKGTGSNWAQQNYYSDQTSSGDMEWWGKQGSPVTGIEFNHVAVAGWNVQNGIDNSVNPNFDPDTPQYFSYTGSISSNSLIQDKRKLKAIAILVDRSTGKVVNAAQSEIADFATAVNSVTSNSNIPEDCYSLDGRKLPNSQKGINIIRMTDGTIKKVLVK